MVAKMGALSTRVVIGWVFIVERGVRALMSVVIVSHLCVVALAGVVVVVIVVVVSSVAKTSASWWRHNLDKVGKRNADYKVGSMRKYV